MIRQTLAILLDAYRDLNARKLFWITLVLSAVVVTAFGTIGVGPHAIKLLWFSLDTQEPLFFYKFYIFSVTIIGLWLTWVATILGLVSTAGIFPDFISGGSIDLYLSKPVGRLRLFLTKYLAGLLFVALQVLIVAGGSFLVMGLRIGQWKPSVFWAIPIVLCFFSYLFSICVLLGIWTRSTIAALLLTILAWFCFGLMDRADPALLALQRISEYKLSQQSSRAEFSEAALRRAQDDPKAAALVSVFRKQAEDSRREAEDARRTVWWLGMWHRTVYALKAITPKTTDTIGLLDQFILSPAEVAARTQIDDAKLDEDGRAMAIGSRQAAQEVQSRSIRWIVGTSLVFEAVMVACGAWVFCRRDY